MHGYTKRRYTGYALTMRRLQCTQYSIHTIVKHDNIGNYIAQWSYNNNYMIANDACTFTYIQDNAITNNLHMSRVF